MSNKILATTIPALYLESAQKFGNLTAFSSRGKDRQFHPVTYQQLFDQGAALATALLEEGLRPGENVAILADNRFEWILTDYGCQLAGCADVPRGTDVTDADIAFIIPHSEARFVFVENNKMAKRLLELKGDLPGVEKIIVMVSDEKTDGTLLTLQGLLEKGEKLRDEGDRRVEEGVNSLKPEDPFTLIYTSGTTGTPKGVVLSHANIISQIKNIPVDVYTKDRFITILPIWHIFERMLEMAAVANGSATYYTGTRTIRDDLKTVQPTIMASTPRLWEMVYTGIVKNAETGGAIKTALFQLARKVSGKFHASRRFLSFLTLDTTGRSLPVSLMLGVFHLFSLAVFLIPHLILDLLVLSKIREATGGKIRASISGGGALPSHIDYFFNDCGIPILEGYGLTETSPVLAVRTFTQNIIGSVGPLWPETELRIVDVATGEIIYPGKRGIKGEIHVKGPQVMEGYYKNPEMTDAVMKDGWFNTGDLGMMTYNDCLKIMGRSKETIVLFSGENVEPQPIENKILESNLIQACMLVGQDQKFLAALIVPDHERLKRFGSSVEEISSNDEARKMILSEIKSLVSNENGFKNFEKIGDCRILPRPFEVGRELNNAYKLKRNIVMDEYEDLIASIYKS